MHSPEMDAAEVAWSRFREAASRDFKDADFQVMSIDTFKSLLPHYGVTDPIECARVEVRWRAQQMLRQPEPQTRDVAPFRADFMADVSAAAEAAAAAAASAAGARLPAPVVAAADSPHVSPHRLPATPPQQAPHVSPAASPYFGSAVGSSPSGQPRPMTGLLSPARPPSPPQPVPTEPEPRPPVPQRRSQTPTTTRVSRSPSAGGSMWSYPAVHPQPFCVPLPEKPGPSLSRRRRLCPEDTSSANPNASAHLPRNLSPSAGIRHCNDRQAQASVNPNLRVARDDCGSPSRRRRVFAQTRRRSVTDVAGAVRRLPKAGVVLHAAVGSNPNPDGTPTPGESHRRSLGAVKLDAAATGDPNAVLGEQCCYAREAPQPTAETQRLRRKGNSLQTLSAGAPVGTRVVIPKRGNSRSRSVVAPATSDPNGQHEGSEQPQTCRGQAPPPGDHGVMPPYPRPEPRQRTVGPAGQAEQGVIPGSHSWRAREGSRSPCSRRAHVQPPVVERCVESMRWPEHAEAPPSPCRKGRSHNAQWREELRTRSERELPKGSPSRRRRTHAPTDGGVMPGSSGWN